MHQNENLDATIDSKSTGWAADFRHNPDQALKNFVIKNLPYQDRNISDADINFITSKFKEYIELYNISDDKVRQEKMEQFLDPEKWRTQAEQDKIKAEYNELIQQGESPEDVADYLKQTFPITSCSKFQTLNNVLIFSTFRQTSKLGLNFFHEQKVPVMFQFSDYTGKTLTKNVNSVLKENFWKEGHKDPLTGGSAITNSELRHANRLQMILHKKFNIKLAPGGNQ